MSKRAELANVNILMMAGGTGGHVFPALAVAHVLSDMGATISWLGTKRGIESRLVPEHGFSIYWLSISGLRGKNLLHKLWVPFQLFLACLQAAWAIIRIRPRLVIGMGGFVTGPGGAVARALGRPLIVHEQNSVAGMTNRWLARIANRVLEAFPGSFASEAGLSSDALATKTVFTGNPVRAGIAALGDSHVDKDTGAGGALRLLVIGGSLGALALNDVVPEALALLPAKLRPSVWHQCGTRTLAQTRDHYQGLDPDGAFDLRLDAFVDDMVAAYQWADVVLCRAGAMTVAEIAAAGLPAIFIPYPHAVDDHQTGNARYLSDAGAARLIPQQELTAASLADVLGELGTSRDVLTAMSRKALAMARPQATQAVVNQCIDLLGMEDLKS